MNYIYDILINFNSELYDFYDWNLNDNIDHIRKIPVFKIKNDMMFDLRNNDITFEKEFLNKIYKRTEYFTNKNIKNLNYACLFCDGMEVMGINIVKGEILKSRLLIDEETEVIEVCDNLDIDRIKYKILKNKKIPKYKTRKEIEMEKFVKSKISDLQKESDINKLSYLYYECFNEKETNKDKILKSFNVIINNNFGCLVEKLYNFFKLSQFNK